MLNLLKADFVKLRKSKAFWICALVGVAMGILMVVAMNSEITRGIARGAGNRGYAAALAMQQSASAVYAVTNFLPQGFLALLAAVFTAIFISSEFSYGTVKNTLSRGAKRVNVYASKLIVCVIGSLFIMVVSLLVLTIAASVIWGFDPQSVSTAGSFAEMILLQLLLMLGFAALFAFLSMTIRSTGGALATNMICTLMVSTLLNALNMLFNDSSNIDLNQYWLGGAVSTLATTSPASGDVTEGIIVALCWAVASTVVGIILFNKRDVK